MTDPAQTPPTTKSAFTRATLDRNMTVNITAVKEAIENLDLTGLAIFDFGCGNGNILRLLKNTNAHTVYAFEVMPEHIDKDIREWIDDAAASPRLILNPPEFKISDHAPDGDLTNYDYFSLLKNHDKFAIISNPPYFLYNRILSLTGTNLAPQDKHYESFAEKFFGGLVVTSKGRLINHPGWHVVASLDGADFDPPASGPQYVLQIGFEGRNKADMTGKPVLQGTPQRYPAINNRKADEDNSDCYPEMWAQLDQLRPQKPSP
jgi:SAM-dependent methyltransferase